MESIPTKAHQACGPCKKHKRKCDKGLPACGLCARTERACEYDETPRPPPSAEEFAALQARMVELENCLSSTGGNSTSSATLTPSSSRPTTWTDETVTTTRFPSALFLDADSYEWSKMKIPSPTTTVPMVCLSFIVRTRA
jgi:hypothetical protein